MEPDVFFRQIRGADQAHCAYLVGDLQSRQALVFDPVPSVAEELRDQLRRHGLELVGVFETFLRAEPVGKAESRFQEMVSLLGMSLGEGPPEEPEPLPWEGVPRGGPVEPWRGAGAVSHTPRALFSWRGTVRELSPLATEVFDARRDTLSLQFRSAFVHVGEVVVEVLPVGDRPDAVAYRVGGGLITGAMLWSDRSAPGGPRTGDALLELPSDTWVFPRRVGEQHRATLLDERNAWRHHHSSDRTHPPLEERGFLPVLAGGIDAPGPTAPDIGSRDAAGFRDVDPAEALVHLNSFMRVVLVGDSSFVGRSLPGAEILPHQEIVRRSSEWAEDEPVLIASEMGERCRTTARALVHNGLRHVYRLVGGSNLWESCGLPTEPAMAARRRA